MLRLPQKASKLAHKQPRLQVKTTLMRWLQRLRQRTHVLWVLVVVLACVLQPCVSHAASVVLIEPPRTTSNPLTMDKNPRFGPVLPPSKDNHVNRIDFRANALRHSRAGEDFMDRGYYGQAIQAFQVSIGLNPDSRMAASVYHNLALCYRALNQFPLAIMSHQRAMRLAPGFAMYAFHLARTYKEAGAGDVARQRFKVLAEQQPDNRELQLINSYLAD
jgi:tetratricopeptide (TPR) repeat protein